VSAYWKGKKRSKRSKSASSRRSYYPRRNYTGVRRSMPPLGRVGPAGNSLTTSLKYAGDYALNPAALGLAATQQFQNSAYDPDLTGAGHQPAGWDQLIALFEHCTVFQIDYKIQFLSTDTGTSVCGVYISDTSTIDTDYRVLIENGQTEWAMARLDNNPPPFSGTIDVSKIQGITRAQLLGNIDYACTNAGNPNDPIYMTIFNGGAQNTDTGLLIATVELTFHCQFFGSRKLDLS